MHNIIQCSVKCIVNLKIILFITLCCTVVNVRFVQPDYTFNEDGGRATVCLTKDLETGVNFTVFVFTINGSALGEHKHALTQSIATKNTEI